MLTFGLIIAAIINDKNTKK
ncbi:MAG: hypothetical protein FWC55_04655 [Firmicutes bacterium]|nr:hypothetical protein [Bacillota bacterium]